MFFLHLLSPFLWLTCQWSPFITNWWVLCKAAATATHFIVCKIPFQIWIKVTGKTLKHVLQLQRTCWCFYICILWRGFNWMSLWWIKYIFMRVLEGQPINQHLSCSSTEYLHVQGFGERALFLYKEYICISLSVNVFSSNLLSTLKSLF